MCWRCAWLKAAFRGGHDAGHARVVSDRHSQRASQGFKDRFGDVMSVDAFQIVDVQRYPGVVDETLEKLPEQIDIEASDHGARKFDFIEEPRAAGQIDCDTREGFVERYIRMTIANDALLVADRLREGLAERDADVFDGMVRVDFEIALRIDLDIDQAVPGDLIQHVVQKRNAGDKPGFAGPVQIQADLDLRFERVAFDASSAWVHDSVKRSYIGHFTMN